MKISVIVPIYNVEQYIAQCIDSILAQDYPDMEIILVDDGSPDNAGRICDCYAEKDERIQVIHKINGGLSDARNAGIAAATGEYVLFLDGDDLWDDPHAVTMLVERITQTNADVLNFSYIKWYEDTGRKEPYFQEIPAMPKFDLLSAQLDYLTKHGLFIASACNKLVRRALLHNLPFERGIYSEDIQWCAKLLLCARSMDFICANFYLYRQRSNSIRHTINDKMCADLTNNIISCVRLAEETPPERKAPLLRYTAFQLGTFFMVQAQAERPQFECIRRLRECCWVLKHSGGSRKVQILHLGCSIFSFPKMCRLIRFIFHHK